MERLRRPEASGNGGAVAELYPDAGQAGEILAYLHERSVRWTGLDPGK